MSRVEINLNGPRDGRIVVDGHDLGESVHAFSFNAEVRSIPTLTLTLDLAIMDATRIESAHTAVHMTRATHALLVAAGWTPPEHVDPTRIDLNPTPEDQA